ncbi:MAG: hypothetical protein JSV74_03070 [Dehalococcoidia bacterium]|nr:MAG: hypothetical protein JSV74_03070 [Dehalococcoidia bacterium]
MLYSKSKKVVISVMPFALSALFVLTGCQSNQQLIPVYRPVEAPPLEVTLDQVLSDYISDEETANITYGGKRLLFSNIEVERIKVNNMDDYDIPIVHIVSNGVEFKPRFESDTTFIREGFVLDIIGEVDGWFGAAKRYLVVKNCWVKVVEGDAGSASDWEDIY